MENKHFENFDKFSKAAVEAAKELETINGKVFKELTEKNMELFNTTVELNRQFFSLFGETKGLQELVTEQMKLSGEYNGKVLSTIKEVTDIVTGSKDDYQAWIENGIKTATDNAQAAVAAVNPAKAA